MAFKHRHPKWGVFSLQTLCVGHVVPSPFSCLCSFPLAWDWNDNFCLWFLNATDSRIVGISSLLLLLKNIDWRESWRKAWCIWQLFSPHLRLVADRHSWCQFVKDICMKNEEKKTFPFWFQCVYSSVIKLVLRTRSAEVKQTISQTQINNTAVISCNIPLKPL